MWPDTKEWEQACHVEKDAQFGGSFDGNACRRLLKNSDILDRIVCSNGLFECKKFVTAFKALDKVVESCFGANLEPMYKDHIAAFKQAYYDLNISITPKIHAILFHVPQFCESMDVGLGRFSEQASESVHCGFKAVWTRGYKVGATHPEYASRLLRAVNVYNTEHI